jgi:dTDP-4-dehydrorhamnose reductase
MEKILITGASGFLGWNLCRFARSAWDVFGVAFRNDIELQGVKIHRADLAKPGEAKKLLLENRPDALIHAAAAADLNFCQMHRSESRKINVEASAVIASLCAEHSVRFVFISTDMVFDGLAAPYREEDPVNPINVYGEQKAEAERLVFDKNPESIVCRMPLLFGDAGPTAKSFIQPMAKAMKEGREISLFTDEYRTPVSGRDAAKGIFLALAKARGYLHLGGPGRVSRYDFGVLLRNVLNLPGAKLAPCSRQSIPMAAPRPRDVSFDSTKAEKLGFKPGDVMQELRELFAVPGGSPV